MRSAVGVWGLTFVLAMLVGCTSEVGAASEYVHAWSDHHWASSTLSPGVSDDTGTPAWDVGGVVADWAGMGTPLQPRLSASSAEVSVRERRSPFYLGLAEIRLDDTGHIVEGRVLLNPVLLSSPYTAQGRQHVVCQELGHIWGLDHQIAQSCMDDCAWASTNSEWLACINDPQRIAPDAHDGEQLELAYDHVDDDGTGDEGGGGGGPPCSKNPSHPRCSGGAEGWITVHALPRRL